MAAEGSALRRGLRLLREGIVILASIMAAFLLDGWRADRELARDLRQELENVSRELERNRDLVVAELTVLDRLTSSTGALLDELRANPEASTVAATDTLALLATVWSPTIDPSLGAVEALISSGRLAQVPNPRIRQGLAGLRDQFEDAREEEVLARAVFSNEIFPLTRDRLDYRALRAIQVELKESGGAGAESQESMSIRAFPSLATVAFPNSPAIRNALELRRMWYLTVQDELARLQTFLSRETMSEVETFVITPPEQMAF